ncbi:hypothetical protein H8N01_23320 [Streptomyces sp. AC536]|uniref:hypothetical protein n=1 Tax=Streptomyces buecherae TaxID=2763006 RepID=UPI00164EB5CC|nr:hypothetical protein [Streptomyces buecherae]MBC3985426.1 hypothetical protein [Streptomyces buecherae]QNJ42615.1 hypothetical protein H7H31_25055 [Streptomyces buecherae]
MSGGRPPHFHAYSWIGPKPDVDRERDRRPESPGFAASELPPLQVAHWLRKPGRFVRATYEGPGEAAAWLAERVGESVAAERLRPPLDAQVALAVQTLGWGGDIGWGAYLTGTRFLSLAVVACPNRADPSARCPLR